MKILVVEDEKNIREGIISILNMNLTIPFKLKSSPDSTDALSVSETFYPDLVITDIAMPGITGLELIRKMKERQACKNFIILSGHDNFSYAQQAIRFGVMDYLLKPLDKSQLLDLVQKVYDNLVNSTNSNTVLPFAELEYFSWDPDTSQTPPSLQRIIGYINKNYMKDISLQTISEDLFFHTSYISSLINKYTDHSFTWLLDHVRIRKAAELLISEPDMSIMEISDLVGYRNERRLYAAFQKRLNMTPGDFKRLYL